MVSIDSNAIRGENTPRQPETFVFVGGHNAITYEEEITMANSRTEAAKPMPFPGESPTVSLAMAAGRMYAPKPEDEKPKRAAPKRRKAATKRTAKSARTAGKASPRKRATRARGR